MKIMTNTSMEQFIYNDKTKEYYTGEGFSNNRFEAKDILNLWFFQKWYLLWKLQKQTSQKMRLRKFFYATMRAKENETDS